MEKIKVLAVMIRKIYRIEYLFELICNKGRNQNTEERICI